MNRLLNLAHSSHTERPPCAVRAWGCSAARSSQQGRAAVGLRARVTITHFGRSMPAGCPFCIKMPACVQPGVCSTMPAGHLFNRACTRSTIVLDVFNQVEQVTGAVRWLALLLSAAAAALPVAKAQGLDAAVLAFNDAMRLRPDFARRYPCSNVRRRPHDLTAGCHVRPDVRRVHQWHMPQPAGPPSLHLLVAWQLRCHGHAAVGSVGKSACDAAASLLCVVHI